MKSWKRKQVAVKNNQTECRIDCLADPIPIRFLTYERYIRTQQYFRLFISKLTAMGVTILLWNVRICLFNSLLDMKSQIAVITMKPPVREVKAPRREAKPPRRGVTLPSREVTPPAWPPPCRKHSGLIVIQDDIWEQGYYLQKTLGS